MLRAPGQAAAQMPQFQLIRSHLMLRMIAIVLVFLAALILSACGSTMPSAEEAKWFIPLAQPLGKGDCELKGPGFEAPQDAQTCDIFGPDKLFLGRVEVEAGKYHCSVPGGYVRCLSEQGQRLRPNTARAMCPFDGDMPYCPPTTSSSPYVVTGKVTPYWATQKEALEAVKAKAEGPQADGAYVACAYSSVAKGYTCVRSYGAPDGNVLMPPAMLMPPLPDPT